MACNCNGGSCSNEHDSKVVIKIDEEEAAYLNRLVFERSGLSLLVAQFASDSPYKPEGENFDKLMDRYVDSCVNFDMAYVKTLHKYEQHYIDRVRGNQYESQINFLSNELIVTIKKL